LRLVMMNHQFFTDMPFSYQSNLRQLSTLPRAELAFWLIAGSLDFHLDYPFHFLAY